MSEIIDPRQSMAISLYKNPTSEYFGNLYQSLLKAGYADNYAKTVYNRIPDWLSQNIVNTVDNIQKADKNINKYLNYEIDLNDPKPKDMDIMKIQADLSKFVTKQKYGGEQEDVAPSVQINIVNYSDTKPQNATEATITDNTSA
jgi:hypothetical protein